MPIRNKTDYRYYLQSDLATHSLDKWKLSYKRDKLPLYYQRVMRKTSYYNMKRDSSRLGYLYRQLYKLENRKFHRLGVKLGFTMVPDSFGPGLRLSHYGSIIVNQNSNIGKNCVIEGCVTIGKTKKGEPMIGDNVYIGTGAKVIGKIKVGDNVTIGANAVVTKDVPDKCVVVGVPAKVINTNAPQNVKYGADEAKGLPLPITKWDKTRLVLGLDKDLKNWPAK